MLAEWLKPLLEWLGVSLPTLILLIIAILLLVKEK